MSKTETTNVIRFETGKTRLKRLYGELSALVDSAKDRGLAETENAIGDKADEIERLEAAGV